MVSLIRKFADSLPYEIRLARTELSARSSKCHQGLRLDWLGEVASLWAPTLIQGHMLA